MTARPRRALAVGLVVAVVTQAAWMVPYYLATNGCFCSHGRGPMPSWANRAWLVSWVETGTLPATAVISPTGPWIYVIFNTAFGIAVVFMLSAVLSNRRRRHA
jgi:hypothetical protein